MECVTRRVGVGPSSRETFRSAPDARSDVFSLRLTLLELIAIKPGFVTLPSRPLSIDARPMIDAIINVEVGQWFWRIDCQFGNNRFCLNSHLQLLVHIP